MESGGGNDGLLELLQLYVRRGVIEWCEDHTAGERRDTARTVGLPIVESEHEALTALYQNNSDKGIDFIPMPRLDAPKIEWAFFAPRWETRTSVDGWVFDLFLLLDQDRHLGFRLEPADGYVGGRHEFSHVQLSWRFGHKLVEPAQPLKWLPDSYPAFPLPGTESVDRFLMLLVALHGFPGGVGELLREIDPGRPIRARNLTKRVNGLLGGGRNGGVAG